MKNEMGKLIPNLFLGVVGLFSFWLLTGKEPFDVAVYQAFLTAGVVGIFGLFHK